MAFQPKSGQITAGPGFKPKSGQIVSRSAGFQPSAMAKPNSQAQFDTVDISKVPEGADPSFWNSLDEAGKRSFAVNWSKLSPERKAKLLPGQQESGYKSSALGQTLAFGEDFARNLGTAGTGAMEGAVKGGAGIAGALSDVGGWLGEKATGGLIKAPQGGAGQAFRDVGDYVGGAIGQTGQDLFKGDPMARAGGNISGQILAMAAPMGLAAKAEKGIKGIQALQNAPKVVKGVQALGGIGAESAISTAGATAVMEGRMPSFDELAAGGALDFALRGLGGGLGKMAKGSYNKLLGLTRGQKGKMAEKGLDLGQALANKKYVGLSRTSLANKIQKDVSKLSDKLDGLIRKAEGGDTQALAKLGETSGFTANDLLKNVDVKNVFKNPKLKPKFGEMDTIQNQIKKAVSEFRRTVGNKTMTLSNVQEFKKSLGNSLSDFYSKTGDAKATARELVNDLLRGNAKKIIEVNVKDAKKLNNLMAPLIEAKNVLKKKGDYSGKLTDFILGGAVGGGSLAQGQSPTDALKNMLLVGLGKRMLMSPGGRSIIGATAQTAGKAASAAPTRQAIKSTGGLEAVTNFLFGKKD